MDYCGATTRGGGTCRKAAGWGTPSRTGACRLHGGNTPTHRIAAQRREAEQAVVTYGLPRDVDPAQALLEEVQRTAGHVAYLEQVVRALDPEDLVWGVTEIADKTATEYAGTDVTEAARPSVWLELYHRERAHLVKVSKAALDAGISERLVRLAESQGAQLAEVIRRTGDALLGELGAVLGDQDAERVRGQWAGWLARIVPEQIAAVTTPTPA